MKRREFCKKTVFAGLAGVAFPFSSGFGTTLNQTEKQKFDYKPIVPRVPRAAKPSPPKGLRIAFDWDYFTLHGDDDGMVFDIDGLPTGSNANAFLRLQVALDNRNEDEVEVFLASSNRKIGHLSIWYPTGLQLFETKLDCDIDTLKKEGIRLRLIGGSTAAFFFSSRADNGSHLLLADENMAATAVNEEWKNMLCSNRSLQPFCWTEGCTLDGLQELYSKKNDQRAFQAIESHLAHYLIDDENLVYTDLSSRPKDNTFTNLETGLPFAVIGRHRPSHPSVELFLTFCRSRFDAQKQYIPDSMTTEGCYTLAYPLAVLANKLKQEDLYELSLLELEQRIQHLTDEEAVYGSGRVSTGKTRIRRNWGRGYAWFLLGLVRSGEILQQEGPFKNDARVKRLREVFRYYAHIALSFQQPDYSWNAYLDQPETFFESSGTGGIAAALAHGHRIGWFPEFTHKDLQAVYDRLLQSTTPDGLLKEVSQHNAGSMNLLQRGGYRVIAQYALGFLGHIKAHL